MSGVTKKRGDRVLARLVRNGRSRHHRQDLRDLLHW